MATRPRANTVDLAALAGCKVACRSPRGNRLIGEGAWADTNAAKLCRARFCFVRLSLSGGNFAFDSFGETGRRAPIWVKFLYAANCCFRPALRDGQPSLLRRRGVDESPTSQSNLTRAATRARNVLGDLRTPASAIRPFSARASAACRHPRLVRIEAGFDRAFELAQLGLDPARAKEPVQAMELRADSVGMQEAVPLSDPADRVSALTLAGILRG